MNNEQDILFDQNETANTYIDSIDKIIEDKEFDDYNVDKKNAMKRLLKKMIEFDQLRNYIGTRNQYINNFIFNDINLFNDLILIGEIKSNILSINKSVLKIDLDLKELIKTAIYHSKTNIIKLLMENIDICNIEPRVVIMAVEKEDYDLLFDMLTKLYPIDIDDYRAIYQIASYGKLDILKYIFQKYNFNDLSEISAKICVQAIINNHVNILEYFCPSSDFDSVPDIIFEFFIKSIQYGGHLPIIKYFVENGILIKQDNYNALNTAIKFNRHNIIKYFYKKDQNIKNLLTDELKKKLNIIEHEKINKFIGTDKFCLIDYNNIKLGDEFYECNNELHQYNADTWNQWINNDNDWKCPHCFSPVKMICYINKMI